MPQTKFVFKCAQCGAQNYIKSKNRQNVSSKLVLSKHCPTCRQHTQHDETRLRH